MGTYLLLFFIRHQLLTPVPHPEVRGIDQARVTQCITSSTRSAYAISSNWLDLWRSSTFRYYLHLDAAMSLTAYSSAVASPLERFSDDERDRQDFLDYGIDLMRSIGRGENPLRKHRFRLLIYPQWVYDQYTNEVLHLIRSHTVARIPCIPLISELLYEQLSPNATAEMLRLVEGMEQTADDKLPPASRWSRYRNRRRARNLSYVAEHPVFPDMLLIDAHDNIATTSAWWYSHDGHVQSWDTNQTEELQSCNETFRQLCANAEPAIWSNYAPATIGGVVVALGVTTLEAEAFFAREHYSKWLDWIRDRSSIPHGSAQKLYEWLQDEERVIEAFVAECVAASGEDRPISILDIGCGFGRHLLQVLAKHPSITAVGVDINPPMIGQATAAAKSGGLSDRTTFLMGDASVLNDCQNAEFDLAICMTNTLGNLLPKKQVSLIQRLSRVLKPGGRALFSVYAPASVTGRLESYQGIGLRVQEQGDTIVAAEGLVSEHFSESRLRNLIEKNGLSIVGGVEALASVGWKVIAERPSTRSSRSRNGAAVTA